MGDRCRSVSGPWAGKKAVGVFVKFENLSCTQGKVRRILVSCAHFSAHVASPTLSAWKEVPPTQNQRNNKQSATKSIVKTPFQDKSSLYSHHWVIKATPTDK